MLNRSDILLLSESASGDLDDGGIAGIEPLPQDLDRTRNPRNEQLEPVRRITPDPPPGFLFDVKATVLAPRLKLGAHLTTDHASLRIKSQYGRGLAANGLAGKLREVLEVVHILTVQLYDRHGDELLGQLLGGLVERFSKRGKKDRIPRFLHGTEEGCFERSLGEPLQ